MNHLEIARAYSQQMEQDPKHQALILFGSVSRGEYHPDSDLDFLLLHQSPESFQKRFWEEDTSFMGVKVGTAHLDYGHFRKSIILQPFNRIILTTAQVMFDKTETVSAWIEAVKRYFYTNPDIQEEWDRSYVLYKSSKTQSGVGQPNIKDLYMQFAVKYRGRVLQEDIP